MLWSSELFSAVKEIGFLGQHWMTRYHKSDFDVPTKNMFGQALKETNAENKISEIVRRLQRKPKYENLLVDAREDRHPRAIGMAGLENCWKWYNLGYFYLLNWKYNCYTKVKKWVIRQKAYGECDYKTRHLGHIKQT